MHFSIPDTLQVTDEDGKKYWLFNVNVNGVFHCSLRYSQLDKLNEQLKKEFPTRIPVKLFPGKKLFALSPDQLEERRDLLEKYIQALSQDPEILNSDTFVTFFLRAQQKTRQVEPEEVTMDIYLMNGNKINISLNSLDQADDVLEIAMKKIGLPPKFVYYFGLYLVSVDDDNNLLMVRRLQDFEAPYLSLKATKSSHRVVIRKSYWTSKYDIDLMDDRIALNLLYVQASDDIERRWTFTTNNDKDKLKQLTASGLRREFVEYARSLKYYGYIHFTVCEADYPNKGSQILMSAGEREFSMRVHTDTDKVMEGNFKVQRIRSWKLASIVSTDGQDTDNSTPKGSEGLQFSFEYLFAKGDLRWITIHSSQAILMSMSMQGMIDEILNEQQGRPMKVPKGREKRSHSLQEPPVSKPSSHPSPKRQVSAMTTSDHEQRISTDNGSLTPTGKKIAGKVQGMLSKKSEGVNEVFEDIGDDDL